MERQQASAGEIAAKASSAAAGGKKLSSALLESIERRKKAQASPGNRPTFRRGRRPKRAAEYTPVNSDDDSFGGETEGGYETIEHDTGIRVGSSREDAGFGADRVDDFDEELDFDR